MTLRTHLHAILSGWADFMVPWRRRIQLRIFQQLHTFEERPGLVDISARGRIARGDTTIAWYEVGPPDSDTTVVFIHGFALSAHTFYYQVDALREQGVRCLLVDLRGHGLSHKVAPQQCTIADAALDCLAVLEHRPPQGKMIIVGHSLGGMVALSLIEQLPAQLRKQLAGLVTVGSSMRRFAARGLTRALESWTATTLYRIGSSLPSRLDPLRFWAACAVSPVAAATLTGLPDREHIRFHAALFVDTPLATLVGFFDDVVKHHGYGAASYLESVPGEIIVGSADILAPVSQAQDMAAHWPRARLSLVAGAGHMVILERPEVVNAAIARLIEAAHSQPSAPLPATKATEDLS